MVGGFLRIFFGPDSMRSCVARLFSRAIQVTLCQFSFYCAYILKTEWASHPPSLTRRHPEPSDVASGSTCALVRGEGSAPLL